MTIKNLQNTHQDSYCNFVLEIRYMKIFNHKYVSSDLAIPKQMLLDLTFFVVSRLKI